MFIWEVVSNAEERLLDFSVVLPDIESLKKKYDPDGVTYVYRVLKSLSQDAGYFASYFHQMPLEWRKDVSIEDLEAFDRYKDHLNSADLDLIVCIDLLEQLRFDDVAEHAPIIRNYLQRCYDLLSCNGIQDGLYHISLYDSIFKRILRYNLVSKPDKYGISSLKELNSSLIDFRTKWHSVFCFRVFLQENMSKDKYKLLVSDSKKFYMNKSGYFDRAFQVGATIGMFDSFNRPAFVLPNNRKLWNLSGKKLTDYLDCVSRQPGFILYKDDFIKTISNLKNVDFSLPDDYEFPLINHMNWRTGGKINGSLR